MWPRTGPYPNRVGDEIYSYSNPHRARIFEGFKILVTVIPGVVFSGSFDGGIRAYSTRDGSVLWNYDTNREFATVNGVPGHGGSINGPAAVIVDGMIYASSGDYRSTVGNVLLAFGMD